MKPEKYAKIMTVVLTAITPVNMMYILYEYTHIQPIWVVAISNATAVLVYFFLDWVFRKNLKKES